VTDDLARRVAERVAACPGVAGLSGGPFGTVATYLPGGEIRGVALRDGEVEIHVVARYGRPMPEIGAAVHKAVADLVGDRNGRVTIDDITAGYATDPATDPATDMAGDTADDGGASPARRREE
jgi:hypothetical protein